MCVDRAAGTYVSTTIDGIGTGTEIRVTLDPIAFQIVDVTFEFLLAGPRTERTAEPGQSEDVTLAIGQVTGMAALYRLLPWARFSGGFRQEQTFAVYDLNDRVWS